MAASGSPQTPDAYATWSPTYGVDLEAVLGPFVRGRSDPSIRLSSRDAWLTMRMPEGPATVHVVAGELVVIRGWGPGAVGAVDSVPGLLGNGDDPRGFRHDVLPEQLQPTWRRYADRWRIPSSGRVVEALVAAVLEQKVTGVESRRAWSSLLREVGSSAPGPAPDGMHVFPTVEQVRRVPSWQWHRWGVQPPQSATIMRAMQVAGRLQQCVDLDLPAARARLAVVPGIGRWTVAEVTSRALGDPDSVSFADYHLAGQLVYIFTGERGGDDARMAELLEPFAGHRYRVQRLVELSGITLPARGPRMTIADHRRH